MAQKSKSQDAKGPTTFEEALERLERLVEEIESGQVPLEQSVEKYTEGTRLVKQCRTILDAAEKRIQLLAKNDAGALEPAGEPAEDEGS